MIKAIGYTRVSTATQASDGVSLKAQEAKIQAWAVVNDAEMLAIYVDQGISGTREDRPGLKQALELAIREKAALVVYSLSRLSRSTRDTIRISERLGKAGADLVSLSESIDTTTAAGKMVFRMLAVLNEFERDQISDRTKAAIAYKKSKHQYTGGEVPYGFALDNGILRKDQSEQAVIQLILELRARKWNYSRIARELNELGYRTKTGKAWHAQQVKNVIIAEAA